METVHELYIRPNYISVEEERFLLRNIHEIQDWNENRAILTKHYGFEHISNIPYRAEPIPAWCSPLLWRLNSDVHVLFDQIVVSVYSPGLGLASQIDDVRLFGDIAVTLSLCSGIMMHFDSPTKSFDAWLPTRSAMVFQDDLRYGYFYSIIPRDSDIVNGRRILRKSRIALTFRKVIY
jgi:hypothetical protein